MPDLDLTEITAAREAAARVDTELRTVDVALEGFRRGAEAAAARGDRAGARPGARRGAAVGAGAGDAVGRRAATEERLRELSEAIASDDEAGGGHHVADRRGSGPHAPRPAGDALLRRRRHLEDPGVPRSGARHRPRSRRHRRRGRRADLVLGAPLGRPRAPTTWPRRPGRASPRDCGRAALPSSCANTRRRTWAPDPRTCPRSRSVPPTRSPRVRRDCCRIGGAPSGTAATARARMTRSSPSGDRPCRTRWPPDPASAAARTVARPR